MLGTSLFVSLRRRLASDLTLQGVFTLGFGMISAQAVALIAMPLLTRMYSPEAFGVMGTFIATITIVAPLAAFSYPTAIVIAQSKAEALALARLSISIAVVMTALVTIFSLSPIAARLLPDDLSGCWIVFSLPIALFLIATQQITDCMLLRMQAFKESASATFIQTLLSSIARLLLGLTHPIAASLVAVAAVSPGIKALIQWPAIRHYWTAPPDSDQPSLIQVAKTHAQMPLYRAPQSLINAASHSLPIILLGIFFGQSIVGLFALAKLVMDAPSNIAAKSLGDVLYARLSAIGSNSSEFSLLVKKSTFQLALIGIIPLLVVWTIGPWLFSFIFGSEWRSSGELARWVAVISYALLVARPSVAAIPALNLQKRLLLLEAASVPLRVACFVAGYSLFESPSGGIGGFAMASIAFYLSIIFMVKRRANEKRNSS